MLPDGGDPTLRGGERNRRRLASAAAIFTNQQTLGAPATTMPSVLGV